MMALQTFFATLMIPAMDVACSDLSYLSMGKSIPIKDNYQFLLPQGEMGHNENKAVYVTVQESATFDFHTVFGHISRY